MKWNWIIVFVLGGFFLFLGFLVLRDQYMQIGVWFQWQDVFHHETFAVAFFAVGFGIFIGSISQAVLRAVE
jgi:hypothetical protein